jgi:hypothetical protein
MRQLAVLALCSALLAPAASRAADVTPADAAALREGMRSWIAGLTGLSVPDLPITVTPEGDHFRVGIPTPGATDPAAVSTLVARPQPNDVWTLEQLSIPSPLHYVMRTKGKDGAPEPPTDVTLKIAGQDLAARIDRSQATPSNFAVDLRAVTFDAESPEQRAAFHADHYRFGGTVSPASDGVVDLTEEGAAEGITSDSAMAAKPPVLARIARAGISLHVDGLRADRSGTVTAASVKLMTLLPQPTAPGGEKPKLSPEARAQLHQLILALSGYLRAMGLTEQLDGMEVRVEGHAVTVAHAEIGVGGDGRDGILSAHMKIGMDGLSAPELPPEVAPFMPRHISISPSVTGLGVAELTSMALDATDDPPKEPDAARIDALFAHGGVKAAIDEMSLDVGPTHVDGHGLLTVASPSEVEAHATVTATGVDALIRQVQAIPDMQPALAILVYAKGLARNEGNRLVWDIAASPAGLTVNGIEPMGARQPPPRPAQPSAPGTGPAQRPRR